MFILQIGGWFVFSCILMSFIQETLRLPALAAKLSLAAPTGIDAHGYGIELKGIVTKSVERLSVHFNGGYEVLTGSRRTERDGRYELTLGASYPNGGAAVHAGDPCR